MVCQPVRFSWKIARHALRTLCFVSLQIVDAVCSMPCPTQRLRHVVFSCYYLCTYSLTYCVPLHGPTREPTLEVLHHFLVPVSVKFLARCGSFHSFPKPVTTPPCGPRSGATISKLNRSPLHVAVLVVTVESPMPPSATGCCCQKLTVTDCTHPPESDTACSE